MIAAATGAINHHCSTINKDKDYQVKTRSKLANYISALLKLSYHTSSRCRVSSMPTRSSKAL